MTGALFQLKALGKQDSLFTENPEYNFIKQTYNKYTNFAIEEVNILPNIEVDFGKNWSVTIPKQGDYLNKLFLYIKLPKLTKTSGNYAGWTNSLGYTLMNSVTLKIGGNIIDKRYGLFLEIWEELTAKKNSREDLLLGKYGHVQMLPYNAELESEYYIPIPFWFCQSLGASLPLFALKYNPIEISFEFSTFDKCIIYDGNTPPVNVKILEASIVANYIYIDNEEREKIKDNNFEYIITQIQDVSNINIRSGGNFNINLPFNHPCSEIIFILREEESENNNDWYNFAQRNPIPFTPILPFVIRSKLLIDGIERIPSSNATKLSALNIREFHSSETDKYIYCIPFCSEPESYYPTGTLNFSRIANANLNIDLYPNILPVNAFVFARNFNIIKIKNGEAFIGFSS
jgi:hypothetical protein